MLHIDSHRENTNQIHSKTRAKEQNMRALYFALCSTLLYIICNHVFGPTFRKKTFHFNSLIQLFIYLYLETKPIIVFRGIIILHVDIIIAF